MVTSQRTRFGLSKLPGRRSSVSIVLLVLVVQGLAGCSTKKFTRVDPALPIELEADEALLAFHVDSELQIRRLILSGLVIDEIIPAGRRFWIAKMRAGPYSWRAVYIDRGPYIGQYRIQRSVYQRPGELDFEVRAGQLNYAGELIIEKGSRTWARKSISVRIRNHAGQILRRIEAESPELLDRFRLHTAGTSGDRFLEFYLQERARLAGTRRATSEGADVLEDVPEDVIGDATGDASP